MKLIIRLIIPLILGITIGSILKLNDNLFEARILMQILEVLLWFIDIIVPIMIFIYLTTAFLGLKGNVKSFLIKYFKVVLITLIICAFFSFTISYFIINIFEFKLDSQETIFVDPFMKFSVMNGYNEFNALVISVLFLICHNIFKFKLNFLFKIEFYFNQFIRRFLLTIMPLIIICSFSVSTFESSGLNIIVMDFVLSFIVLLIQFIWIFLNYIIISNTKVFFKKVLRSGLKIYMLVLSIAGVGTGAILPDIISEQKKLGYDENKAKFITTTSFNMPGSLISNVVFSLGIMNLYNVEINFLNYFIYLTCLCFILIIAPSLPGAVFSVTSQLLSPILGFDETMIGLMSGFYYRQGTSNSAINNCCDIYISGYLSKM